MIGAAKDLMVSKAAKAYLSNLVQRYGEVRDFKIDSSRNRIELTCMLNGEREPISVTIEKYLVDQEGPRKYFQVLDSSATRPWLQAVLRDHLHGRRFEVPGWASAAL